MNRRSCRKLGHEFDPRDVYIWKGRVVCRRCAKVWRSHHKASPKDLQRIKQWARVYYAIPTNLAHKRKREAIYRRSIRLSLMERLGGVRCTCCGETQYEFLSFDHIYGGGIRERQLRTGTARLCVALRDPEIHLKLQVLCHNCNQAKGYYGQCPHQLVGEIQEVCH